MLRMQTTIPHSSLKAAILKCYDINGECNAPYWPCWQVAEGMWDCVGCRCSHRATVVASSDGSGWANKSQLLVYLQARRQWVWTGRLAGRHAERSSEQWNARSVCHLLRDCRNTRMEYGGTVSGQLTSKAGKRGLDFEMLLLSLCKSCLPLGAQAGQQCTVKVV